jgi:hypothetical protein
MREGHTWEGDKIGGKKGGPLGDVPHVPLARNGNSKGDKGDMSLSRPPCPQQKCIASAYLKEA